MPWQEMAPPVPSRPRPAIWSEGKALRGWVWAVAVWPWFRGSSLGCKVPNQHQGLSRLLEVTLEGVDAGELRKGLCG